MIDILKAVGDCQNATELVAELSTPKNSTAKVFRTSVLNEDDNNIYTFMTTSKDVHLGLGRLSFRGRHNLLCVIMRAFEAERQSAGLLTIPGESSSLLVTLVGNPNSQLIQLAPAH